MYLVTSTERVVEERLPFVFTDRNAALRIAGYGNDLQDLDDYVDWDLMEGRMWKSTDEEPDRQERRMAEFLVHPAKVEQARQLAAAYGLPDIDDLLVELNDRRKFEAYGDIELPEDEDRDAQDTAAEIRAYFEAVEAVLGP